MQAGELIKVISKSMYVHIEYTSSETSERSSIYGRVPDIADLVEKTTIGDREVSSIYSDHTGIINIITEEDNNHYC